MVSPAQKKTAVAHVVTQRLCSLRRACRGQRFAPTDVFNRFYYMRGLFFQSQRENLGVSGSNVRSRV